MADVNDIVVYGFGAWSSVNSIPTLGFGSSTLAEPQLHYHTLRGASREQYELRGTSREQYELRGQQ